GAERFAYGGGEAARTARPPRATFLSARPRALRLRRRLLATGGPRVRDAERQAGDGHAVAVRALARGGSGGVRGRLPGRGGAASAHATGSARSKRLLHGREEAGAGRARFRGLSH